MPRRKKVPIAPSPCEHHKKKELGYIAWHDWAASMNKKKIYQSQCPDCGYYLFPEEM